MKKISLIGVVVGGITDIVSTNVFAVPFLVYVIVRFGLMNVPPNALEPALISVLMGNKLLLIVQSLPGIAGSILGGYVAAVLAKRDEVLNGTLSAFLCIALGIYAWLAMPLTIPVYLHVLGFVMSPALGALGGWLRLAQARSKARPPTVAAAAQ